MKPCVETRCFRNFRWKFDSKWWHCNNQKRCLSLQTTAMFSCMRVPRQKGKVLSTVNTLHSTRCLLLSVGGPGCLFRIWLRSRYALNCSRHICDWHQYTSLKCFFTHVASYEVQHDRYVSIFQTYNMSCWYDRLEMTEKIFEQQKCQETRCRIIASILKLPFGSSAQVQPNITAYASIVQAVWFNT